MLLVAEMLRGQRVGLAQIAKSMAWLARKCAAPTVMTVKNSDVMGSRGVLPTNVVSDLTNDAW